MSTIALVWIGVLIILCAGCVLQTILENRKQMSTERIYSYDMNTNELTKGGQGQDGICGELHCAQCAPEFYCWSGKSTCNKRPASPAMESIEEIIADSRRVVCESHHTDNPPAESVIISLATKVFLARQSGRRNAPFCPR